MGIVDDYLAGLEPNDATVIAGLYAVAREEVPEAEQGKSYGMPALLYRGKPLLSLMRTKKHIGLYPYSGQVVADLAAALTDFDCSTGTIRFQPERPVPDDLLREVVRLRRAQIDSA